MGFFFLRMLTLKLKWKCKKPGTAKASSKTSSQTSSRGIRWRDFFHHLLRLIIMQIVINTMSASMKKIDQWNIINKELKEKPPHLWKLAVRLLWHWRSLTRRKNSSNSAWKFGIHMEKCETGPLPSYHISNSLLNRLKT